MSNSASRAVNIGNTYGATFIGLIFSSVLYGVTIVQSHGGRSRDSMIMKGFIVLLLVLDTVHTVFCIYVLYWYLIENFADINNLDIDMWAMEAQVNINTFVAFLIQLIVFPVVIVGLAVLVLVIGFVFTVRETDSMIMTLMIYSINTGLLTSVLATASLISAFYGPLGKCYVNSLLALLNNRESIREGSSHVESNSGRISYKPGPGPTSISVTVHRTANMAMDLAGNKDDDSDTEPSTLELKRLVRVLHSVATPRG
ncbi:hypothetical protein BJV74DRAFT_799118 [Russula compacta]|nr:hypothetical protein BJV74DRAFT_799118 [Russula compacta]